MSLSKRAILALTSKVVALTERRLKAGKYEGDEKHVADILDSAKKVIGSAKDED